jgi:hypothetical protein
LTCAGKTLFYRVMRIICLSLLLSLDFCISAAQLPEGVRRVQVLNYPDCFELFNAETRVTLCHHVGGRVLERNGARPAGRAPQTARADSTLDRNI